MAPDLIPPPEGFPHLAPPPASWTRVDQSAQPHYYAAPYPPEPTTNALAIVGFVGSLFVGVIGIVCGHIALAQIRRTGEKGRGLALAGAIIGYGQLALFVLWGAFVIIVVVVGGVTDTVATSSDATPAASPTADCATVEKASLTLSTALTNIANSSWKDAPAAAKEDVITASNQFPNDTQTVSDNSLAVGINFEQTDLALLGSAFVDYEAAAPGQEDAAKVTAALTKTSDDLADLTSTSTCQ